MTLNDQGAASQVADQDMFEKLEQALGKGMGDIHPTFTRLRQEAAVVEGDLLAKEFDYVSPMLHIGGRQIYSVLRYDEAAQVLREPDRFLNEIYAESVGLVMGRNVLCMDGQEHRDKRLLLQHAFTKQVMAGWKTDIVEPLVHEYIDGFEKNKRADLVREFMFPFPVNVIHRILGLPPEGLAEFHRLAVEMLCIEFDPPVGFMASQTLAELLMKVVEARRADLGNDIVSVLIKARENGQALSDDDVLGFLRVILPAGGETTARATGTTVAALLNHPEQLAEVLRDRSLIPKAVEEAMRWDGPLGLVYRNCAKDTEIDGVVIPEGAAVNIALCSAHRDETKWESPERFDIHRTDGPPHLGFSAGPHTCMGLHLGRLEAVTAVHALLDRLPNLRPDPEAPPLEVSGLAFRGPATLPVIWD